MGILCLFGFHKWMYNDERDKRTCTKCSTNRILELRKRNLYGINESGKVKMVPFEFWIKEK